MKIVVKNKFLFIFIILFMIFSIISYSFSNVKNVENYYVESNQNLKLEDNVSVIITKDLEKGLDYRNVKIEFGGKHKQLEEKLN